MHKVSLTLAVLLDVGPPRTQRSSGGIDSTCRACREMWRSFQLCSPHSPKLASVGNPVRRRWTTISRSKPLRRWHSANAQNEPSQNVRCWSGELQTSKPPTSGKKISLRDSNLKSYAPKSCINGQLTRSKSLPGYTGKQRNDSFRANKSCHHS
ncbi:hypothetical protein BH11PAT4_BH11PAT4_8140 [soil metagenome]